MKDKHDTKTQSLQLGKTNAERQREYRARVKRSKHPHRLDTYISNQAHVQLDAYMQRHELTQIEAVTNILESMADERVASALDNAFIATQDQDIVDS
ncbi:hypothetical protein AB7B51_17500 [Acinetobacter baumannii]|uniref:hypothetical protein n=1 Tax=Acinetobacter baumannii TaxID=470 RepID=UPI0034E1C3CC